MQYGEAGPGAMEGHDFSKELLDVNTVTASVRKGKKEHTSGQTVAGARSEYSVLGVSTLGFEDDDEKEDDEKTVEVDVSAARRLLNTEEQDKAMEDTTEDGNKHEEDDNMEEDEDEEQHDEEMGDTTVMERSVMQ